MTGEAFFKVIASDAIEFLRTIPDGSVDLLISDPAYASLEKHRAKGTTTRLAKSKASSNEWFPVVPNSYFDEWFRQCYRVLKKNAHLYVMCDMETMWAARPKGEAAGFTFWKDIIWNKLAMGMGYHYRAQIERILFFEKGKRKLNDLGVPDFLDEEDYLDTGPESIWVKRLRGGDLYPTEKPPELSQVLISQSSAPGEVVLDMFMGSGSTGVAALQSRRHFIGCDIQSANLAADRLAAFGERGDVALVPEDPQASLF